LRACECGGLSGGAPVSDGAMEPEPRMKNGGVKFISLDRNGATTGDYLSYLSTLS
jgi:hypothetical protein